MKKPSILVIIDDVSDKNYFSYLKETYSFIFEIIDLSLSPFEQAERIIKRIKKNKTIIDGIFGPRDKPSVLASILIKKLGKNGLDPSVVHVIQHKALFSERVKEINESYPATKVISSMSDITEDIIYPAFIKPVRSAVSADAYIVENKFHLTALVSNTFAITRRTIEWFGKFDKKMREGNKNTYSVHSYLLQPYIQAKQYTVDGVVYDKKIKMLGITESVYMKERKSFDYFEFPATLSIKAQKNLFYVLQTLLKRFNYNNSAFNLEFFVLENQEIVIIELNTRLSLQFNPLISQMYDTSYLEMALQICIGKKPIFKKKKKSFFVRSYVLRKLEDGVVLSLPSQVAIEKLFRENILVNIHIFVSVGKTLSSYSQDAYTYRYAFLDIMGASRQDIEEKYLYALKNLSFRFSTIESEEGMKKSI